VDRPNFAKICLVGPTVAQTGSDIKAAFRRPADGPGYQHFRCLLDNHCRTWTVHHGPRYNERRPLVWEPLKARPTIDQPKPRQHPPHLPSRKNHVVQRPVHCSQLVGSQGDATMSTPVANNIAMQITEPPPLLPSSPPWITERQFEMRPADETLHVIPVSPSHSSPMSEVYTIRQLIEMFLCGRQIGPNPKSDRLECIRQGDRFQLKFDGRGVGIYLIEFTEEGGGTTCHYGCKSGDKHAWLTNWRYINPNYSGH
jgi:hypothetical protein